MMSGSSTLTVPSKVLSEDALQVLRTRGSNPVLHGGFRAVSNTSYLSADSLDSEATVLIPDQIESLETLEFLQFKSSTAEKIWRDFCQAQLDSPDRADIVYAAKDHIKSIAGDACYEEDDWVGIMQAIGLSSNYQARVMDAEFSHMRLTASAKEWALEMIEMRYEFLCTLDTVIRTPSFGALQKMSHIDADGNLVPGPKVPERRSSKKEKGRFKSLSSSRPSSSDSSTKPPVGSFKTPGSSRPSSSTSTDTAPVQLDGTKMFYKGSSMARLLPVFKKDGSLDFTQLWSRPPGDFSDERQGLYLTKHQEVAYQYAQWAKKLVDGDVVPVGILQVAIPDHLFVSVKELYGEEWRRFVWACRTVAMTEDLEYITTSFRWLTGPICQQSSYLIKRMSGHADLRLWKLKGGETAGQHFTAGRAMANQLNEACVGKVWVSQLG